jgi:Ca2+-binding EF-hand superfamily protein
MSAGRLLLYLNTIRKKLETRLSDYVTARELENLFYECGFEWLSRSDLARYYELFDLNKSGNLHIAELLSVITKAISVCRDITRGSVNIDAMRLERFGPQCPETSLVRQLISSDM